MTAYDFDLLTIGAGSGGVRASRLAASFGAKVGVIERSALGGTCVNLGCIPKKLLAYAAHFHDDFEDAAGYGWSVPKPSFEWTQLIRAKDAELARLNGVYQRILESAGCTIIPGAARFLDPHTVEVEGRKLTAARFLVATGSRPRVPEIPGGHLGATSDQMFHLERLPERVVIAGGGYIAVEFAGILSGLGAQVTLVHRGHALLRGFDEDLRQALGAALSARGIDLRLNTTVDAIRQDGLHQVSTLSDGSELRSELNLCAVGRIPNTAGLGLEVAGVTLDAAGAVVVNADFQTSQPHIYALGDVIDRVTLTPVALAEATAFANTVFNQREMLVDYTNIPSAVFSQPPIGTVGLTEAAATAQHGPVDVYESRFNPLKNTLSGRVERTYMKLIVHPKTDRVLGCHMLGPDAPEILQGMAVAMKCGATKRQLDSTVGIHPTAAEELVTMRTKRS
jgi:glutathione reductase (NADPH)